MAQARTETWTVKMLKEVISKTARDKSAGSLLDEVLPGVYLGRRAAAEDVAKLQELGVTHVMCCCSEDMNSHSLELKLKMAGIHFLGFPAKDCSDYDLTPWYKPASEYIDKALKSPGKILVHCYAGFSRSAAIVIAYLMLRHHMTAGEAVRLVRSRRFIGPNDGFLKQLCALNVRLRNSGHFSKERPRSASEPASDSRDCVPMPIKG